MSDTLESLRKKREGAIDLGSVVRTMKVMAASNIGQYEMAVRSLEAYYRTIELGILAYFQQEKMAAPAAGPVEKGEKATGVIVFGSDQGLVGRFNDSLADFVMESLGKMPGKKLIWAAGERIYLRLGELGLGMAQLFPVPNSVSAITPLVGQLLILSEQTRERGDIGDCYIFHNRPKERSGYEPVSQRFLPLDRRWRKGLTEKVWPTKYLPQVVGDSPRVLATLIREYLFVSLYKSCAESIASENTSRLGAMQRAEKSIDDLLEELNLTYNRLRQSTIDEELFDVIATRIADKISSFL